MPSGENGGRALALPVAADGGPATGAGGPATGAGGPGSQGGHDGAASGAASASTAAERSPEAWLVAIKDSGPLSDFDRLTLHQAVTIVALELLRERVAGDTERRLAGDVLAAVVRGELAGPDLSRRLGPFGLSDRVAAIVVGRPNNGRGSPAPAELALAAALRDDAASGLVASNGALTCALVPGMEIEELIALGERVADRLATALGAPVQIGVGRGVSGGDARRTFHEARCALEALSLSTSAAANGDAPGPRSAASAATATSAPSSCSCRSRTTRLCDCSAIRSSARSKPAKDTTAVS